MQTRADARTQHKPTQTAFCRCPFCGKRILSPSWRLGLGDTTTHKQTNHTHLSCLLHLSQSSGSSGKGKKSNKRAGEKEKKKKNRPDRMNTNMSTGEDSYPFKPLSGRRLSNIEQYKQRAAQKRQERIQVGSSSLLSPPSSPPSSFLSSLTDFCGNVQLRFASSCL